jgi:predicted PurR-regulated permease PerM
MSPELIGITGVGIALLTVGISLGALMVTLIVQSEKRLVQRIDRLEDHTTQRFEQMQGEINHRFEQVQGEINRRFDAQDERIRGLEQGQSHLSGQFSILKDFFYPSAKYGIAQVSERQA